jgi:transcriptional antiterminator NusG
MSAAVAKQWFVVRVQSGREDKVRDSLERRVKAANLDAVITRVLVPAEKVTEIKGGKRRVRDRKLYAGYLLIEADTKEGAEVPEQAWYLVRETPGIGDFLGSKKPVPMAQHEVDKILMVSTASADKPKLVIAFQKGDSVRIKEGLFENMDGVVEEVVPEKGLVRVSITIFGRATPVELESWQIEKI